MEGYFNVFHFIAIAVALLLSALFVVLFKDERRPKMLAIYIAINTVATALFGFCAMLMVDKYTKQAVLQRVSSHRVLINESIVFKGSVRNVGEFSIANCDITVRLINAQLSKDNFAKAVFKPSGLSFSKSDEHPNVVELKVSIAKNLKPKETRNFSVSMKYPAHFTSTNFTTELECH